MSQIPEQLRAEMADVLEVVAEDGLPNPTDMDVALDALSASIENHVPWSYGEPEDDIIELTSKGVWTLIGLGILANLTAFGLGYLVHAS